MLNREATNEWFDHINVATINIHTWHSYHEGPSGAIEYLAVGTGCWQYAVMNDGWP